MDILNKICMVLAFVLGALFMVLGAMGLIFGCNAHFTLPPILGVLPAIVGWGIIYAIKTAWSAGSEPPHPVISELPQLGSRLR